MVPTGWSEEPIEVLSSPGPERRPRRRWLIGGAILLLAAAAGGLWLARHQATRAQFQRLADEWAVAQSLDSGRVAVIRELQQKATPSDAALVKQSLLLVQADEARRLSALRAHVSPGWTHDGDVDAVAEAESSALAAEIAELRRPRAIFDWDTATQRAIEHLQHLLAAGRHRFGMAASVRHPAARFAAAERALARLDHLVDAPVPARLLVSTGFGQRQHVLVIDLQHNTVRPLPAPIAAVFRREVRVDTLGPTGRSPLIVQTTGAVYSVDASLTGQPRRLGRGVVMPALGHKAIWLYGYGRHGRLVEVSTTGRRLSGPFRAPEFALGQFPTGLTVPTGFVLSGSRYPGTPAIAPTGIWLWHPHGDPTLHQLAAGCAQPLATRGALLAWLRCAHGDVRHRELRVMDTTTGHDRRVAVPRGAVPAMTGVPNATFSPDGKSLAYYCVGTGFGGYALGITDLDSGRTTLVRRPPIETVGNNFEGPVGRILWTPDSAHVFYGTGASATSLRGAEVPFAVYHVARARAENIRFHERPARLLAILR